MKTIIAFVDKETGNEVLHEQSKDNYLSFDKENDFRIMDIFIVNDQINQLAEGLKVTCVFHQDWCIKRAVKKWGKEVFNQ